MGARFNRKIVDFLSLAQQTETICYARLTWNCHGIKIMAQMLGMFLYNTHFVFFTCVYKFSGLFLKFLLYENRFKTLYSYNFGVPVRHCEV